MDDKELFDAFKKEIRARGWDVAEAMEKIGASVLSIGDFLKMLVEE